MCEQNCSSFYKCNSKRMLFLTSVCDLCINIDVCVRKVYISNKTRNNCDQLGMTAREDQSMFCPYKRLNHQQITRLGGNPDMHECGHKMYINTLTWFFDTARTPSMFLHANIFIQFSLLIKQLNMY